MLLHGLYGNAREWLPIARALEDDFHLVAPDLRNHGASPHAPRQSVSLMADDVLCALEGLTITPYAVMGHSMGGLVAQQMAVTAPERVRCVVLLDSPLLGMSLPPDLATNHCAWQLALERACAHQGLEREAMRALLLASMPAAVAERLLANYVRRGGAWGWRLGVEGIHHYVCPRNPCANRSSWCVRPNPGTQPPSAGTVWPISPRRIACWSCRVTITIRTTRTVSVCLRLCANSCAPISCSARGSSARPSSPPLLRILRGQTTGSSPYPNGTIDVPKPNFAGEIRT